ncbi:Guanine deaminase [Serratia plymuthica]|uniref:Guanine deaminase n=1 Tax=Serratia plymuthica TaxID=82996 RepID=A0A2X4UHL2_SERPL|nr:Guanine deaminase [Serratia plymuthica]
MQRLREEFPDAWLHTHLSENLDEVAWVKALFPENSSYLDVYHQYGLTGEKSVFAHCLHLEEQEWDCLCQTGSAIAFCPTSNLFLGSGLFNLQKAWAEAGEAGHRHRCRRRHHLQYAANAGRGLQDRPVAAL